MRRFTGPIFAALVVATGGCAGVDRGRGGVDAFYEGRYAEAESVFVQAAEEGLERHAALNRCRAASSALARGDFDAARRYLMDAYAVVEDLSASTGEQTAAVLGEEGRKTWKGEPYERALVSFYAGLCNERRGDRGNALAGYKNAILHDSASEEEAYRSDVPLYWMMRGRVHLAWGQEAEARRAFAEAERLAPGNPHVGYERNREANVVLLADIGAGPERIASGRHGSMAAYRPRRRSDVAARVLLDGKDVGRMPAALDVYREATTRGGRAIDGILAGKALFKDAATAAGAVVLSQAEKTEQVALGVGLILLGHVISARADTRHWETLPAKIHVWTGRLEPGTTHTIEVEFLDRGGRPVPGFRKYRARFRVEEGVEILLYARSGPHDESSTETTEAGS